MEGRDGHHECAVARWHAFPPTNLQYCQCLKQSEHGFCEV